MAVKVVDASALAALLFDEPEAADVAAELGDSSLVAPALLEYELGNTCWKKCRRYPDAAPSFVRALGILGDMALSLHDVDPSGVVGIAVERNVTYYDASYLWLAETLQVPLVTLDARLGRAQR
jgi:predicted nucleic acid-binding protein